MVLANGQFFGGGIRLAPTARLDDGCLAAICVGPLSLLKVFANLPRFYSGRIESINEIQASQVAWLAAESKNRTPVEIELDGEVVGRLPATFRVIPNRLRVLCG